MMRIETAPPKRARGWLGVFVFILFIFGYTIGVQFVPIPTIASGLATSTLSPEAPATTPIVWPDANQAALGVNSTGVLTTHGEQSAHPIASIAKLMLALSVLDKQPLEAGQDGPILTLTARDVQSYRDFLAENGSVVPVVENEQITEHQMLQALLLPSGDNIADTLARWAFGSMENYLTYANQKAQDLGFTHTYFDDASGVSEQTVSTAQELIELGQEVLKHPVLADIVSQSEVELPIAGTVKNVNWLLGYDDFVGIKTGNTPEAGGCFLFAVKVHDTQTIIGVLLGAANISAALHEADDFVNTNRDDLKNVAIAEAGDSIGQYATPWGSDVSVTLTNNLNIWVTDGAQLSTNIAFQPITAGMHAGDSVGSLTVTAGDHAVTTAPVVLAADVPKPPFTWRLLHP